MAPTVIADARKWHIPESSLTAPELIELASHATDVVWVEIDFGEHLNPDDTLVSGMDVVVSDGTALSAIGTAEATATLRGIRVQLTPGSTAGARTLQVSCITAQGDQLNAFVKLNVI